MITATQAFDTVVKSAAEAAPKAATVKAILGEFDKLLKANLAPDKSNKVSEEDLFAAVVRERVEALKGGEAATKFSTHLEAQKAALKKADGFIPTEQATINALKKMVGDSSLTADEGSQIYSEAFAASQLDDNATALFDSRGGPNDPTMAMATLDVALKQARGMIEKLASGETELTIKSLASATANGKSSNAAVTAPTGTLSGGDYTPQGTTFDGPEGFLFKPITNNEGKLAVLLGQNLTSHVSSVLIKDSAGNILEEGKLQTAGIKETGREKWGFSKKGAAYPKDISVEVTLASGEVQRYQIPDPSKRYD